MLRVNQGNGHKMQQTRNELPLRERVGDPIRDVVYLLRKIMQGAQQYTKKLHKTFNVSTPQLGILRVLNEEGPLSPSQIARRIMVQSSTVTGILDRLEQKGLVTRERDSPDRRVITVYITDPGRRLAESAPPPLQIKIVNGLRRLKDAERREIINGLTRLAEMIDTQGVEVEGIEEEDDEAEEAEPESPLF